MKLKKYTYKEVIKMVNILEGNDYTEVLTLTRDEKDKEREEEKIQAKANLSAQVQEGVNYQKGADEL